jgi:hypothetical protein
MAVHRYRQGMTITEIAAALKINYGRAAYALRKAGEPLVNYPRSLAQIGPGRPAYWALHHDSTEVVLGRKFCSVCGRWRLLVDFPYESKSGRIRSRCEGCQLRALRYYNAHLSDAQQANRRERNRIYSEGIRRRLGMPIRQRPNRVTVIDRKQESVMLDPEPLVKVIHDWMLEQNGDGTTEALARRAGVPPRSIYRLRVGESRHVRLDVADKLAVAVGVPLAVLYPVDR